MTYNAANRKDVRSAEKTQLVRLMVRGEVVTGLMSVLNGRQWMYDLLASSFVFSDPFHHDPSVHAYQSGQRSMGLQLFNDIMAFCPNQFHIMVSEHNERSATADERSVSANSRRADQAAGQHDASGDRFDFDPFARDTADADAEAGA